MKTLATAYAARGALLLYVDMHAHATKRGCFLYGNHVPAAEDQVTNLLFARLMALHTPYLDYGACNFSERNMTAVDRRSEVRALCLCVCLCAGAV